MSGTCYVGCDFTGKLVTHAPHVPLAFTGAGSSLHFLIVIGVIAVAGGLALLADHKIRKEKT